MAEPTKARVKSLKNLLTEMRSRTRTMPLWVPNVFAPNIIGAPYNDIYLLNATHRGDMYHVRVAMVLFPKPIVIYNCPLAGNDLTKYLEATTGYTNTPGMFWRTSLSYERLAAPEDPGLLSAGSQRQFRFFSESMCTRMIWEYVTSAAALNNVTNAVCIVANTDREPLERACRDLCIERFTDGGTRVINQTTILLQTRTTGVSGGVYPELDSGVESIQQVAQAINDLPRTGARLLRPLLCGNADPIGTLPSIGEYFLKLKAKDFPNTSKRDIEAFFLLYAYRNNYYSMAGGFRSGGLDLFTFLGVPTFSISIRCQVGELRHSALAVNRHFQRWNIQYETPRHITTAFYKPPRQGYTCSSPWWKYVPGVRIEDVSEAELSQHRSPLTAFTPYDLTIVSLGVQHAVATLLPATIRTGFIGPIGVVDKREFDMSVCRGVYPGNFDEAQKKVYLRANYEQERAMFNLRKTEEHRNKWDELEGEVRRLEEIMLREWSDILTRHGIAI